MLCHPGSLKFREQPWASCWWWSRVASGLFIQALCGVHVSALPSMILCSLCSVQARAQRGPNLPRARLAQRGPTRGLVLPRARLAQRGPPRRLVLLRARAQRGATGRAGQSVRRATPCRATRGSIGVRAEHQRTRSVVLAPRHRSTPSTLGLERLSAQTTARGSVRPDFSRAAATSAPRAAAASARLGSIGECAGRMLTVCVGNAPTRSQRSQCTLLLGRLSM